MWTRSQPARLNATAPRQTARARGWRGLWAVFLGVCSLSVGVSVAWSAPPEVSKEYQIKAAFLYNFTKFIEWPAHHFATESEPIRIATFDHDPFGDELAKIVAHRRVNGREIVVTRAATAEEAKLVDLVFIGGGSSAQRQETVAELHRAGVVTVGETPEFAQLGGMIVFVLDGDKVRFEIDMPAAEQSGVRINAQLQKLAKTVRRAR